MIWLPLLLPPLAFAATISAASFPCEKAATRVEKTICANAELSELDEYLARYFDGAKLKLEAAGARCLTADQRDWLARVRDACPDAACLKKVYLERLSEWHGLQPGVSMLKNLALPATVPELVWIIPPEGDQVAAPPRRDAAPLRAQGALLNELATGDGFVIRTSEGKKHLLLPAMFAAGTNVVRLGLLAGESGRTFSARGYAAPRPPGDTQPHSFEPSRCTLLHMLR